MIIFLIVVTTFVAFVLIRLADNYVNITPSKVFDGLRFSAFLLSIGGLTGSIYLVVKALI